VIDASEDAHAALTGINGIFERGERQSSREMGVTYSNTCRNKVALVEYENKMLVGSFLFHVLLNRSASGTKWISGVKNV